MLRRLNFAKFFMNLGNKTEIKDRYFVICLIYKYFLG